MPRPRVTTEPAQRISSRGPPNLRTSSSDSDPLPVRPNRSLKQSDGRSPRGTQSNPLNQKKLGTRIADLESQLGLAQEELKSLKHQLVSTDSAKRSAQDQLEKKQKKQQQRVVPEALEIKEQQSTPIDTQMLNEKDETSDDSQQETDVFEVPIEKVTVDPTAQPELPQEDGMEPKSPPDLVPLQLENPLIDELALKNDEINSLKTDLDEKEKELELLRQENESLKSEVNEKSLKISSAQFEIDELMLKLSKAGQDLEKSKSSEAEANEKLSAVEKAKEDLENEMKMLRVQTEQWRKAADAAASVLAGGTDMSGRRISERCGSMDKHYVSAFESVGGYGGYVGSPGMIDDGDDVFGSEKRKGSGIRMFGDLWKKKGQK